MTFRSSHPGTVKQPEAALTGYSRDDPKRVSALTLGMINEKLLEPAGHSPGSRIGGTRGCSRGSFHNERACGHATIGGGQPGRKLDG